MPINIDKTFQLLGRHDSCPAQSPQQHRNHRRDKPLETMKQLLTNTWSATNLEEHYRSCGPTEPVLGHRPSRGRHNSPCFKHKFNLSTFPTLKYRSPLHPQCLGAHITNVSSGSAGQCQPRSRILSPMKTVGQRASAVHVRAERLVFPWAAVYTELISLSACYLCK